MRRKFPSLSNDQVISPSEAALALELVTRMDLLRLKSIARLHARGLPPYAAWDDLLQEAITRVLTGARQKPKGVAMVAFLAGIMRSIRADHVRRARNGGDDDIERLRIGAGRNRSTEPDIPDSTMDLERALIAEQELAGIRRLFADDATALKVLAGLAEGLSAEQIRSVNGLSRTEYDSARKRMRRCLLREGLTCGIK